MPQYIQEKLETLSMTPDDWSKLNSCIDPTHYKTIVNVYQERECAGLPRCVAIFGLCRHYASGKCTSKFGCPAKFGYGMHVN